jgi:hypothetical protein
MILELGIQSFLAQQKDYAEPIKAARPVISVVTGEVIILIWSRSQSESTDPPGELITKRIGAPGLEILQKPKLTNNLFGTVAVHRIRKQNIV